MTDSVVATLYSIGDGVISTDMDGLITLVNPVAQELTGWDEREAIGRHVDHVFTLVNEITFLGCESPIIRALKKGGVVGLDNHTSLLTRDGRELAVSASTNIIRDAEGAAHGFIIVFRDVTERKRAREKLQAIRDRFTKVFNASPSLMAINRVSDEMFIDVNDSFVMHTQYRRDEVLGRTPIELGLFEKTDMHDHLKYLFRAGGRIQNAEIQFYSKSGSERIGLLSAEMINLDGELCILSVTQDITELNHLQRDMARLDRLNMVGEMAATIAHEIRNPMTTVRGFLQMLGTKTEFNDYRDIFDLMIEEMERANAIITEFLALAKDKMVSFRVQDLNGIIKALFPLIVADAINSNMYVQFEQSEIPPINLDEKEIRQLLLNLIRNGFESMSSGGILKIKTYLDGSDVMLAIEDQGKGIDPNTIKKVGTPFFTTKEQGTGLGLAVCYRIAARHHSTIDISTSPKGTTFSVRFRQTFEV